MPTGTFVYTDKIIEWRHWISENIPLPENLRCRKNYSDELSIKLLSYGLEWMIMRVIEWYLVIGNHWERDLGTKDQIY